MCISLRRRTGDRQKPCCGVTSMAGERPFAPRPVTCGRSATPPPATLSARLAAPTATIVPGWRDPRRTVALTEFRDGNHAALARPFAEMVRRGTILAAPIWAYSADTAGSTTMPPLPPGSCDDTIGGAITGQAYRAGVAID